MAAYGEYAFDRFELHGSAAPQRREERREAPLRQPKPLRKVPKKTNKQIRSERRVAFFRAALIMTFAGAMLFVLCLQISVGARQYELARAIAATEAQLREAKSENVRLNAELNGITGIDKICAYATEKLGMVKAESYQVECIDLSGGDAVLFAGGSEVNRGGK